MPDLVVHTIAGYIVMSKKRRSWFLPSVFLLGCIFPDLVRGPVLVFQNMLSAYGIRPPSQQDLVSLHILHSPIPLLFQAWLVSFLFEKKLRKKLFLNFSGGITLHLLLDACQRAYHISYLWLFPFSFDNPIHGLWWADDGIWITPIALFLGIIVLLVRNRNTTPVQR